MVQTKIAIFALILSVFGGGAYAESNSSYTVYNYLPSAVVDTIVYDSGFCIYNNVGDTPFYVTSLYGMTTASTGWAICDTNVELKTVEFPSIANSNMRFLFMMAGSGTQYRLHPVFNFPIAMKFNYGFSAYCLTRQPILLQVKIIRGAN